MKLAQLSQITGIPRHTLTARVSSLLKKDDLERDKSNHIILQPSECKKVIQTQLSNASGKVIRIGNLKGGVGKTSISYLLARATSSMGLKTCVVDLDIQMNLTSLFIEKDNKRPVFLDLVNDKYKIKDILINIDEYLTILPSSLRNSLIEKELLGQTKKHYFHWFNEICLNYLRSNFDIIILDTPPDLSTLNSITGLCLVNNDHFLFPIDPDNFALDGVDLVLGDINKIRSSYRIEENPDLLVVMNRFDQTIKEDLKGLMEANNRFENALAQTIIRKMAKFKEYVKNKESFDDLTRAKDLFTVVNGLLVELGILIKWGSDNETI
ncbi:MULTISPECIES: ParA family protein [Cysteiniphilum]|uniref:ParA family protein n=1 Tax=Cysteiniphilum TaxID=2056696 RepID=UPI001784E289|nr:MULTISPECIES: AAA family ATPase [Cysteiniphilum]